MFWLELFTMLAATLLVVTVVSRLLSMCRMHDTTETTLPRHDSKFSFTYRQVNTQTGVCRLLSQLHLFHWWIIQKQRWWWCTEEWSNMFPIMKILHWFTCIRLFSLLISRKSPQIEHQETEKSPTDTNTLLEHERQEAGVFRPIQDDRHMEALSTVGA